jgi:hypothetical protein
LNEPVKQRSEQGASDENRNDVNEQRSQRSHERDDRRQSAGAQSQGFECSEQTGKDLGATID